MILEALLGLVPQSARNLLEVASGTGQHGAHIAPHLPMLTWWPTEYDMAKLPSISAYADEVANMMAPSQVDVTREDWADHVGPRSEVDVILNINMVHISPWAACVGLMQGAGGKLSAGGMLVLYGPFRQRDVETAPSNVAFDGWLKQRDPIYGLRFLEDVVDIAAQHRLDLSLVRRVPANNLIVVFQKS